MPKYFHFLALDRPVMTGIYTHASKVDQQQMAALISTVNFSEKFGTTYTSNHGYSSLVWPTAPIEVLSVNYYDSYDGIVSLYGNGYSFVAPGGFLATKTDRVFGKPVATKVAVPGQNKFLITVNYYDDRMRLIQTVSDDNRSNKNRVTNEYWGVTSRITKSKMEHGTVLKTLSETTYDHMGRVLETFMTMDDDANTRVKTSSLTYNELGQMVDKKLHGTQSGNYTNYLQSIDFRYNIRGWLSSINKDNLGNDNGITNDDNNDLFGMQLNYHQPVMVNGVNTVAQYNGNISSISWGVTNLKTAAQRSIAGYKYDAMNRLTSSTYAGWNGSAWSGNANAFTESLTYDKSGNIKTLARTGLIGASVATVDQLAYRYAGNQLQWVNDNAAGYSAPVPGNGFSELMNAQTSEYEYDANGNMTADLNKGVTSITYS